ncbi:MAG: hypothetical protein ACXAC8_12970 [Candidatus Hodarchaeales archaeon]|jgi:hypothetical protein
MPYFYDEILGDHSSSNHNRREKFLGSLERIYKEALSFTTPRFESIRAFCDPSSNIFTSVADLVDNFDGRIAPQIHHTKTSPMYEGKATKAQTFDSMVARKYYAVFRAAMTARLCKDAAKIHPEQRSYLDSIHSELDQWIEQKTKELLKGTNFEVIPIQKLVKVQVGSALIAMQNLH